MTKCKFCPSQFTLYSDLKSHVEFEHAQEYARVQAWLGKTVHPKLETYEKLAAEGMVGAQESNDC